MKRRDFLKASALPLVGKVKTETPKAIVSNHEYFFRVGVIPCLYIKDALGKVYEDSLKSIALDLYSGEGVRYSTDSEGRLIEKDGRFVTERYNIPGPVTIQSKSGKTFTYEDILKLNVENHFALEEALNIKPDEDECYNPSFKSNFKLKLDHRGNKIGTKRS